MQQIVYRAEIDDLQKHFKQTRHYIEQTVAVVDAATDQWRDHLRSCVRVVAGTFKNTCFEINDLLDSSELSLTTTT